MEWRETGILLSVRPHGEAAAIIDVMTETHGRHAGLVRGGASRKLKPVLQPGAELDLTWRARLEDHLGAFTVEPVKARTEVLGDRAALAALGSAMALATFALPERNAYPALFRRTRDLVERLDRGGDWPPWYVGWELELLTTLGFGPDLSTCAVSGRDGGLAFVSPRTGRAVTQEAAGEWADRLLPLPPFLRQDETDAPITPSDVREGLRLTGYFLTDWMCPALNKEGLPPARDRAVRAIDRMD